VISVALELVALWLFTATGGLSTAEITAQLEQSLVNGSRLEVIDFNFKMKPQCSLVSVQSSQPIVATGRYAIKVMGRSGSGTRCEGWAWANIRVLAKVIIATQRIEPGELISPNSVRTEEREKKTGQKLVQDIPSNAKASTLLLSGTVLENHHLRIGPAIGESVEVEVRTGQVSVVQTGRVVPCPAGRLCAQLESGKRLEGRYQNGRLVVEIR
jgi:flagella basal body P-ring formation protein FlgA